MEITPHSEFIEKVENLLKEQNVPGVLSLFNDNQYYEDLKNSCWDLIPIITKYLSAKCENDNSELFRGCEKLIDKVADNANPEEALLQFIEEVEESQDDTKFLTLLFPMLKVLQRIPKNQLNSIGWSLNAIQIYLNRIILPNDYETSESFSNRVVILYSTVIRFYDLLLDFYSENKKLQKEYQLVVSKNLVELLGKPLGFFDLTLGEKKTKVRSISEVIVEKILIHCTDPFTYFEMVPNDFLVPGSFSYGILLYLLLCEKIKFENIPKVYDVSYIFGSTLKYIILLLKNDKPSLTKKGLSTVELILQNNFKLSYLYLELRINQEFSEVLENIIVFNKVEKLRHQAFRVFKMYLNSFEIRGQYMLLVNLMLHIKHSGLAGFTITQYKEILIKLQEAQDRNLIYFEGEKLYSFIVKCCTISKEDEYNLLNSSDKIISLLNLMRFVVLQEKPENLNHFKITVNIWRRKFLDPLQVIIGESKKAFKQEKFQLEQTEIETDKMSISVGDENIPDMTKTDKMQSIDLSLTGFDMIESLLDRLIELLILKNCYN